MIQGETQQWAGGGSATILRSVDIPVWSGGGVRQRWTGTLISAGVSGGAHGSQRARAFLHWERHPGVQVTRARERPTWEGAGQQGQL